MSKMYIKHINVCPVWNVLQLLRQQTVGLGRQNPPRDCKQTISPAIIIFIIIVIYFSPLTFISIYCQLEVMALRLLDLGGPAGFAP